MTYYARKLRITDGDGEHQIEQDELLVRREPIVVLGEPGMGKTKLLKAFEQVGRGVYCRAQQLINRRQPDTRLKNARRLLIDALDEVPVQADGGAVDLVLRKLGDLNYPAFILSCRVGEWRSAISIRAIADQYEGAPLEVRLEPLAHDDQLRLLTELTGDEARARKLHNHFSNFELDFLGNPQTLELIAYLPLDEALPSTRGALFEQAIETLRKEINPLKQELPREVVLDAAGAAFAGLILSGYARIVDQPSGAIDVADKALSLVEIEVFDHGHVRQAANTRLFSTDRDGLTYAHRRVGEFVGARWLSARADMRAKRQRLLAQFRSHGLVPASLRGLHAWLTRDPQLAGAVIDADPAGVIEYGDADALSPERARRLLTALERHTALNPRLLGWRSYQAAALVLPPLMGEVMRVIANSSANTALRLLLLQQLKAAPTATELRDELRTLTLNENETYTVRHASALVLVKIGTENWTILLECLRLQARHDASRLALDLLYDIGIETIDDDLIVAIVSAHEGLSLCAFPPEPESNQFVGLYQLTHRVSHERIEALLNQFAAYLELLRPKEARSDADELTRFGYALILKRLEEGGPIEPLMLWRWLAALGDEGFYQHGREKTVTAWLEQHDEARQAIQRHALIDTASEASASHRALELAQANTGLMLRQQDVVALLSALDPANQNDQRWRDLMSLGQIWGNEGQALREAAKAFVQNRSDALAWIDDQAEHLMPEWQRLQEEKAAQRGSQQAASIAAHRRHFTTHIERVRAGDFELILKPAQAYLKRLHRSGDDVPAHKRVADWLGEDVAAAAHDGFEAFLSTNPRRPTIRALVLGYAVHTRHLAGDIIVAALAERLRTRLELPFEGVSSSRLAAGLFECWHMNVGAQAGLGDLAVKIEDELKHRERWEQVVRIYIEPQLRRRPTHVSQLSRILRDKGDLGAGLAENWLTRFGHLPDEAEAEMIDCLLRSDHRHQLLSLITRRKSQKIETSRRSNWDAVALIVDFDAACKQLSIATEPDLLWHLRARAGHRVYDRRSGIDLSVDQLAWIIKTFRKQWPMVSRPHSVTTGDKNPWDASEYIQSLINRLGNFTSLQAVTALEALVNDSEDDYKPMLQIVFAEQRQKQADERYTPPTLDQIKQVLGGGVPCSVADLRAILIEELHELGRRLRGSSEDEVNLYWTDNGIPRTENECRDRTVVLLRGHLAPLSIYAIDEADMPKGKRADIVFNHKNLLLPVEAKRQQHRELWNTIDGQLAEFYTGHWQADGQGLLLVFWFGSNYDLAAPPGGGPKPATAAGLLTALNQHPLVTKGSVEVIVLDVSRR